MFLYHGFRRRGLRGRQPWNQVEDPVLFARNPAQDRQREFLSGRFAVGAGGLDVHVHWLTRDDEGLARCDLGREAEQCQEGLLLHRHVLGGQVGRKGEPLAGGHGGGVEDKIERALGVRFDRVRAAVRKLVAQRRVGHRFAPVIGGRDRTLDGFAAEVDIARQFEREANLLQFEMLHIERAGKL